MLTLLTISQAAFSQVLGIDIGTQFWKVGLISPGKSFVVVQNSKSDRKTFNSLSIKQGMKYFQDQAHTIGNKNPVKGYFSLKKYFPIQSDKQKVIQIQKKFFQKNDFTIQNQTIHFNMETAEGEVDTITLQQLQASIFKNIKANAKKQAGAQPNDVYLVVPSDWDLNTRMSLVNAAAIADMSVLGITSENSAAAVHFALSRNDSSPVNIMMVNMGYNNLHLSIIQFSGQQQKRSNKTNEVLKVLAQQVIKGVGSYQFDLIIFNHVVKQFQKLHKDSFVSNYRSTRKALVASKKAKETLSANKQVQIYIEGIKSGIDFKSSILRQDFQNSAAPLIQKIKAGIQSIIANAGLKASDINSVQLIGGGVRVPCVQSAIAQIIPGVQIGTHMNGDQAMALGSVFMAANSSQAYRVKKIFLQEGFDNLFEVYIKSQGSKVHLDTLFVKRSAFGSSKQFSFPLNKIGDDLEVNVLKDGNNFKTFKFTNLSQAKNHQSIRQLQHQDLRINFTLKLDSVNVIDLSQANIFCVVNKSTTKEQVKYEFVEQKNKTKKNKTKSEGQQKDQSKQKEQKDQGQQQSDKAQNQEPQKQEKGEDQAQQQTQQKETLSQENNSSSTVGSQEQTNQTESNSTEKNATKEKPFKKLKPVRKLIDYENCPSPVDHSHHQNKILKLVAQIIAQETEEDGQTGRIDQGKIKSKERLLNQNKLAFRHHKQERIHPTCKIIRACLNEIKQFLNKLSPKEGHGFSRKVIRLIPLLLTNSFKTSTRSSQISSRQATFNKTRTAFEFIQTKLKNLGASSPWLRDQITQEFIKHNQTFTELIHRLTQNDKQPLNNDPLIYNWQLTQAANDARARYLVLNSKPKPQNYKEQKKQQTKKQEQKEDKKSQQENNDL